MTDTANRAIDAASAARSRDRRSDPPPAPVLSPDTAAGLRADLARHGHCTLRQALSPAEIDRLRTALGHHLEAGGQPAFGGRLATRGMNLSTPIARVIGSDRILDLICACTQPRRAVLTGECDLTWNTTAGWHKDTRDDMDLDPALHLVEDFAVYKMAIYLQDHPASSAAVFKVRPGSHRLQDGSGVAAVPVPVTAGDVVVFDLRLDHAGQMPTRIDRLVHRLLKSGRAAFGWDAEAALTDWRHAIAALSRLGARIRRKPVPASRFALFVTFGAAGDWVHAYEQAARGYHGPIPRPLDPDTLRALALRQVEIIQPSPPV